MKEAIKVPRVVRPKKVKNIKDTTFGKEGSIHMQSQPLDTMATKKMKGLKRTAPVKKEEQEETPNKKTKTN